MNDLLRSQAYLVERGVRPVYISVLGGDEEAFNTLHDAASDMTVIPFVVNGFSGYASHAWVISLLRWADENAPQNQIDRIYGLLLGYSAGAIDDFGEEE
jgi:hypothetical protein